jgi:hypothetical protein
MADEPKPMGVLRRIESILVTAGEECPTNYQTQFDWEKYEAAIDKVKDAVREAMGGAYPRRVLQSLGWTSEVGTSNGAPAVFWMLYAEDDEDDEGPVAVSGGTACGFGDFHEFCPAELRAFAQLAEESGS